MTYVLTLDRGLVTIHIADKLQHIKPDNRPIITVFADHVKIIH